MGLNVSHLDKIMALEQSIKRYYVQAAQMGYFDRIEDGICVFDITASDRYNFPELSAAKQIRVDPKCGTVTQVNKAFIPVVGHKGWKPSELAQAFKNGGTK